MAQPSLAPPGSSSYSSNTLHVGDGTWDATQNTFLLPNIMGLDLATTRYNGMGNRFRQLHGYQAIVTGHGVLAAITFLGIVPTAVLLASFYHRNPEFALRMHISLQVLTVILTTVIFVLGYFAVGPERSLTNPHHGIGLTIYLLVLVQAFYGWIIHKIEKGKAKAYPPMKLMLHQWLGRGITLLAFAQIPIGLALYGSPKALFILYSLYMFGLLVLYFVLVHQRHKTIALGLAYDDQGSYTSGSRTELSNYVQDDARDRTRRRLEGAAGAVGLGAALTALRRRTSGHRGAMGEQSDVASTIPPSQSQAPTASRVSEKFTESDYSSQPRKASWRERLLRPGVGLGGLRAVAGTKGFFGRRKVRDDASDVPGYRPPPLGGHVSQSTVDVNQSMEEGRPLAPSADHWRSVEEREAAQQAAMRRGEAQSRISDDSDMSYGPEKPATKTKRFSLPASLSALGAMGGIGSYFKRRRERKEDERVDAERERDHENERLFTSPGGRPRYTGDRAPRRGNRFNAPPTPITERTESATRSVAGASTTGSPAPHGHAASHLSTQEPYSPSTQRRSGSQPRPTNIPPPPRSRAGSTAPGTYQASPSEAYSSPAGRSRIHRDDTSNLNTDTNVVDPNPPLSPPPAVAATSSLLSPPNPPYAQARNRSQSASPHEGNDSPVASVKVRMQNNGRHVTLRRLNEEEAARERANRRREGRENENSDVSNNGRFRRDQTSAARPLVSGGQTPAVSQHPSNLSLPPQQSAGPSPPSALGAASQATAPYDTGTDMTDFDSNRRRRRAERARAEQARAARRGGTGHVEFQ